MSGPPLHPLEAAYRLRARWRAAEAAFGAWIFLRDSYSAEVIANAGFDWACIDTQHGLARTGDLVPLLQVLGGTGHPTVVRVPWNEPGVIMNALDVGAAGVIVPMVNSAAEAERAVAACRYPPLGIRSWGPARPALGTPDYSAAWANERVLCIVMVETPEAVRELDAILAVQGVDVVLIGPNDLALSFGLARDDAENLARIAAIKAACDERAIPVGTVTRGIEEAIRAVADGFAMVAAPSDAVLLGEGCRAFLSGVRG